MQPAFSEDRKEKSSLSPLSALSAKFRGITRVHMAPIIIVLLIFLFALFVRSYFAYDMAAENDWLMSGGSDSYYYKRLIDHATETGEHLHWDPMLNFPDGARNPRPPLYTFSVAVPAVFFEGLFSSAADSSGFFLIWSTAFWGALTVIPTYLIGRELFGRKTGYISALFLAILPSHVERSVATLSDHDPFVLFFIVLSIYFLMKAMKSANNSKWIDNWFSYRSILSGLKAFAGQNRSAIIYSLLAGLSFFAIAVAWVGFAYVEIIILAYFVVQILINKFKGIDSTTIVLLFLIMFSLAFILTYPVYYQMLMFEVRFDVPVYLFIVAIAFGALFSITRDLPWLIILPVLGVLITIAMVIMMIVNPALGEAILTGQGYFFKSKLYETIAEARAPRFSELATSFGMVTFVLSFFGLFLILSKIPKRVSGDFIIVSIWMTVAVFMAGSAGRFMFNAAPAFAISSAWATSLIIDRLDFKKVAKLFVGSSGSFFQVLRKSVKVRHVLGSLFIVFALIFANTWFSIDAGIPMEKKSTYDSQIYDSLPSFLRPDDFPPSGGLWYLGAFGYSLPLPNYYFPAYWDWFAEEDSEILPESARPAYVSWWDYGFEAIAEGKHPTVADNFQQGYQIAGSIILSQSEEEAIGLLIARTVDSAVNANQKQMPSAVAEILEKYGASSTEIMNVIKNTSTYRNAILENPSIYGHATDDISAINIQWRYLGIYFANLGMENEVALYNELRALLGYSIEYIGIDSRLIQKSPVEGSVFYAPAKLTDRRIDEAGNPYDYYFILAIDDQGIEYQLYDEDLRNKVIVDYKLVYDEAFFKTMIYRAFVGISPSDLGKPLDGLPGYTGSAQSDPVLPGWNLTHFKMVYRTAYFNPSKDASARWQAVSLEDALAYQEMINAGEIEGIVDASSRSYYQAGAVMLRYYDGAVLSGYVLDTQGGPTPGIRFTVLDENYIPHHTVLSDSEGYYSLVLPPGNNTIAVSFGELDGLSLTGANMISEYQINVTDEMAMRAPIDENNDGVFDWQIYRDELVQAGTITGTAYLDISRDRNYTRGTDALISSGEIRARNLDNNITYEGEISAGRYELTVSAGHYEIDTVIYDIETKSEYVADIDPGEVLTRDIYRTPTRINGTVFFEDGMPIEGAEIHIQSKSENNPPGTFVVSSDVNGLYSSQTLLPGEYFVSVSKGKLGAFGESVITTVSQPNRTVDFVITYLGDLNVEVIDQEGSPMKNVSVTVSNPYRPNASIIEFTDETGHASLPLPYGRYSLTVCIPNGDEILIGGASAELQRFGESSAVITVASSNKITGIVQSRPSLTSPLIPEPEAVVIFSNELVVYQTSTNKTGKFEINLPDGEYNVTAVSNDDELFAAQKITVPESLNLNILLDEKATITGLVWHDRNRNDFKDEDEGIPYSYFEATLPDGISLKAQADIGGYYSLFVPLHTIVNLTCDAIGFEPSEPEMLATGGIGAQISRIFHLDLAPVKIEGTVYMGDVPLPGLTVRFINGTRVDEFITGQDGKYSGSLLPAVYKYEVIEPVVPGGLEYYYDRREGVIFVGIDQILDIQVDKRFRVTGNLYGVSPDLPIQMFFMSAAASEEVLVANESYKVYLEEGEYSLYAYDTPSQQFIAFPRINISEQNIMIDIDLVPGYTLSGQLQFGQREGNLSILNITDLASGALLILPIPSHGNYAVSLPQGIYELFFQMRYTEVVGPRTRFLLLTNSTTVIIQSDTIFNPVYGYGLDNSSLSISVSDQWGNPLIADIDFSAMNEYAFSKSIKSDPSGITETTIHPGTYAVQAINPLTHQSYIGVLRVGYHKSTNLNITLTKGYNVMIFATAQNTTQLDNLQIEITQNETGAKFKSELFENQNSASFVLPSGEYTIAANGDRRENERYVEYLGTVQANITSNAVVNIPMTRQNRYSFEISWSSSQKRSIYPGESVTYYIDITNTGNAKDFYEGSGTAVGFEFSFPSQPVEGNYGFTGNIVRLPVTITATADAKVIHDEISISVTSQGDPSTPRRTSVEIDVLPVYSLATRIGEAEEFEGMKYDAKIEIENTGNIVDNYTFSVMNGEELNINGWNVSVESSLSPNYRTRDLEPGDSESINISFTANREKPNGDIAVNIFVKSNTSGSTTDLILVPVSLPDLSFEPSEIDTEGEYIYLTDVIAKKGAENLMLVLVLVVLLAAIFIVRKIKFGRFLR